MQPPAGADEIAKLKHLLGEFVGRLRSSLGERLVSVVLFGGAARGRFDPAVSDVNVMLVLDLISTAELDKIAIAADPLQLAVKLALMTVTETDLGDSAEIFPTKFLDIQRNHEILWGRDVASQLAIPKDRLQRQAVRQLMNLHLRLRQVYLENRHRPEQLDGMIRRSVTTLLLNLGVLLELKTSHVCDSNESILGCAEAAGFDRPQLAAFVEFKYGQRDLSAREVSRFYDAFMGAVETALRFGELR